MSNATRARRRCWYLIGALLALDLFTMALAGSAWRSATDANEYTRGALSGTPDRSGGRRILTQQFQSEVVHALLYRSDQPSENGPRPVCRQDEPTYGQIDTCGS